MKVTKRLIKSVCALAASLVLCIGVCLAWFATNGHVDGNGLKSNPGGINIETFTVTAYKLKNRTVETTDGVQSITYTVGDAVSGSDGVKMIDYGTLDVSPDASETALLLKFDYKFKNVLNKQYAIYAHGKDTYGEIGSDGAGADMILNCALSSVVSFYEIGENESSSSTTVTQNNEAMKEEDIPNTDSNLVTIASGISDDAEGTFYCIIDYVEEKIYSQYYKALDIEGTTFSTPMDFDGDIEFYMTESTATPATTL